MQPHPLSPPPDTPVRLLKKKGPYGGEFVPPSNVAPNRAKIAMTGILLGTFAVTVYVYSMWKLQVSQPDTKEPSKGEINLRGGFTHRPST